MKSKVLSSKGKLHISAFTSASGEFKSVVT